MAKLTWAQVGSRYFETGVDRGVLYLDDRSGVAWNGLTDVTENLSGDSLESLYFDGEKIGELPQEGSFSGKLTAITYPDEFLEFDGNIFLDNGLLVGNQASKRFHLSYRTLIGNDVDGPEHAYKIHILYNLTAVPSGVEYETIDDSVEPLDFEWDLDAIPEQVPGYRPTAHAIIDSRHLTPEVLADVESILYGTELEDPYLPTLAELTTHIAEWGLIIIEDNGDGSWTAHGPDEYFTMLDATTFQITDVNGIYLDSETYEVSSSVPE